jgi:hypothetical protein
MRKINHDAWKLFFLVLPWKVDYHNFSCFFMPNLYIHRWITFCKYGRQWKITICEEKNMKVRKEIAKKNFPSFLIFIFCMYVFKAENVYEVSIIHLFDILILKKKIKEVSICLQMLNRIYCAKKQKLYHK